MKIIFFVLAAIFFALAAFKSKLGALGTIGLEWLGVACLTVALWIV